MERGKTEWKKEWGTEGVGNRESGQQRECAQSERALEEMSNRGSRQQKGRATEGMSQQREWATKRVGIIGSKQQKGWGAEGWATEEWATEGVGNKERRATE